MECLSLHGSRVIGLKHLKIFDHHLKHASVLSTAMQKTHFGSLRPEMVDMEEHELTLTLDFVE